jgi:hypothetical protein
VASQGGALRFGAWNFFGAWGLELPSPFLIAPHFDLINRPQGMFSDQRFRITGGTH